jgi:hypothetical protein
MKALATFLLVFIATYPAMPQEVIYARFKPSSGGAPTITVTSAFCVGNGGATTATCTLAASAAVGDLLVLISKSATSVSTVTWTFTGTPACTPTNSIAPSAATTQTNGGTFIAAIAGCIVTSAGAAIPIATWTGSPTFTDIQAFTVHTTNTWKTTFTDQTASSVSATSTTSCPTGTTSATTNANDFILVVCENFNSANTATTLGGYTFFTGASRNTSRVYYQSVTSTGTQSATSTLSTADFSVGMIVAFASN